MICLNYLLSMNTTYLLSVSLSSYYYSDPSGLLFYVSIILGSLLRGGSSAFFPSYGDLEPGSGSCFCSGPLETWGGGQSPLG